MYEVYLAGFSKPGWKYQTNAGLRKRLLALGALRTFKTCTVKVVNFGRVVDVGTAHLGPNNFSIEWKGTK